MSWFQKITRTIAVSDSYPHHCALLSGSKGKMCCGNCSVGEYFLAKFEGYPAIIGIINIKLTSRLYILSAIDWKEIEGLKMEKYAYWGYLWHLILYKVLGVYKFCFDLFDI